MPRGIFSSHDHFSVGCITLKALEELIEERFCLPLIYGIHNAQMLVWCHGVVRSLRLIGDDGSLVGEMVVVGCSVDVGGGNLPAKKDEMYSLI